MLRLPEKDFWRAMTPARLAVLIKRHAALLAPRGAETQAGKRPGLHDYMMGGG